LPPAAHEKGKIQSREMKHQKQQHKLEELIRDLERDLSEGKSQVAALEETHRRLQESERICQELADENRRLSQEIKGWQGRFGSSEENQRELSMLRQQLEALQAEHARAMDSNRQMQEKLTASSETASVSTGVRDDYADASSVQGDIPTTLRSIPDLTRRDEGERHLLDAIHSAPKTHNAKDAKAGQINLGWLVLKWRVGAVFAGVVILLIVGAVIVKRVLMMEVPISRDPIVFPPEATTMERVPEAVAKPPIRTAPRIRGAFQTVRPTQVFSEPSENSELLANISKGTKVNVVDSKGGWLEIRSKHGRPPGFIRKEATERIGSN
jgi:hypothetical protein